MQATPQTDSQAALLPLMRMHPAVGASKASVPCSAMVQVTCALRPDMADSMHCFATLTIHEVFLSIKQTWPTVCLVPLACWRPSLLWPGAAGRWPIGSHQPCARCAPPVHSPQAPPALHETCKRQTELQCADLHAITAGPGVFLQGADCVAHHTVRKERSLPMVRTSYHSMHILLQGDYETDVQPGSEASAEDMKHKHGVGLPLLILCMIVCANSARMALMLHDHCLKS